MRERGFKPPANFEVRGPVILGAAGDIGRTALQQLIVIRGIVPAGIVLTEHRLESEKSRRQTAEQIAKNFAPEGEEVVLDGVELTKDTLHVGDHEIPVVSAQSQGELLSEGHPVIDATGQNKTREKLEGMLEEGADFVVVSSPIHADEKIPAAVYGVHDYKKQIAAGAIEQVFSGSSCTTGGLAAFLGPSIASSELGVVGALVNVTHAKTKSNHPADIDNNIKLSSSGAVKEVPKILGIKGEDPFIFDLKTTRTNVADGSLADVTLLLKPHHGGNAVNVARRIRGALRESDSVFEIDDSVVDTKGVVGRLASVVLNLSRMHTQEIPGGGTAVFGIHAFYDNVHGYTRGLNDNYGLMDLTRQALDSSELAAA